MTDATDSEAQIVGSILMRPEVLAEAAELVAVADFTDHHHQAAYQAIIDLDAGNEPVDAVQVNRRLKLAKAFVVEQPAAYLAQIAQDTPTSGNVVFHCRRVLEAAHRRQLAQIAGSVETRIGSRKAIDAAGDLVDDVSRLIQEIEAADPKAARHVMPAAEIVGDYIAGLERGCGQNIPTGIDGLDYAIGGGPAYGEMVIIAGRPSMGKTMIALQILDQLAGAGHESLFLSEEMSMSMLASRLLHRVSTIGRDRWDVSAIPLRCDAAEWQKNRATMYISKTCGTVEKAIQTIERAAKGGVRIVAIDYVQLLRGQGKGLYEAVSDVSKRLRETASRYDLLMFCLCQLSRKCEGRQGEPQMSDLRDCVVGETRMQLADGRSVPIKDLVGNEQKILSHDWYLHQCEATTHDVWQVGERKVFKMRTASGKELTATARHRIKTAEGWKRLKDIQAGDYVATVRSLATTYAKPMKPEEVILLAHLIGDGSYLTNQPLRYTTGNEDCSDIVRKAAVKLGGIVKKRDYPKYNWHQLEISNNGNRWHKQGVGKWLRELGIWNQRSKEKMIPDPVFTLPLHQIKLFIKHIWATDGCIHINKRGNKVFACTHFASASRRLCEDVTMLLLRFGIMTRIQKKRKDNCYSVVVSGYENLRRFEHIGSFGDRVPQAKKLKQWLRTTKGNTNVDIIPRSFMGLVRERMKKKGITQREMCKRLGVAKSGNRFNANSSRDIFRRYARELQSNELKQLTENNVLWDKVESIKYQGMEKVYDVTVPSTKSWIANGIITHNSGQLEQDADVIVFCDWPSLRGDKNAPHDQYWLRVRKNRNRETLTQDIELSIDRRRQTIHSLSSFEEAANMDNYTPGLT